MLEQIATCLGGKLLEEMFYKDAFSLEAVKDEKAALEYASEMLSLYGHWKNKTKAEDVVEEIYLRMKEPLWKYDGTACLYKLARVLYNNEFLSAETLLAAIKDEMSPMYVQYVFENDFLGEN